MDGFYNSKASNSVPDLIGTLIDAVLPILDELGIEYNFDSLHLCVDVDDRNYLRFISIYPIESFFSVERDVSFSESIIDMGVHLE